MFDPFHTLGERPSGRAPVVADFDCSVGTRRFHTGIGSLDLLRGLRSSRQKRRPLSLAVHLPSRLRLASCSPLASDCRCGEIEGYLQRLTYELGLVGCHLGAGRRVEQFCLTGGTPVIAHLQKLMSDLRKRFDFSEYDGGDHSIEVDLHHTDWSTMGLIRDQGFTHVSIGVPDIGVDSDLSVDCYQNPAPIHSLIDAARTFGFRSINIDLGYGHAWQTPSSFALKLATLIELEPDRLHAFDYARAPYRYRSKNAGLAGDFCSPADKDAMRRICCEQLIGAGYHYIGLGQFVRADDDLAVAQEHGRLHRNCQGFTRHGCCDHVGFGLSAITQIEHLYVQNTDDLHQYCQQLDAGQLPVHRGWRCEAQDQVKACVTEQLSCDLELDIPAIEARFGLVFREYFASLWPSLEALHDQGLIELSSRFIGILPAGRLSVDAICNLFDPGLDDAGPHLFEKLNPS
ncbi:MULTISPECIES: oxygen-independent coproporphyrinogen III oxidase [Pseudomonas]|uniref:coproporphyrinogen III oxidase n=1 Tax=Pseudomonas TaxID=286 RepID=UPI001BB412F4|nr:coproporphyrinogen III oxidase [Pseudomonas sp. St386]BBP53228.1 oxygen-independent coproporphyrinogen III oxidase [Pseudomonas sp. St386]